MKLFSLPKNKRLVTNRQFKAVLARNLHVSNGLLKVFVAENECGYPRLGVSVAKSCGNAVVRNRLKRLLRESFRQNQDEIPAGFDYLVIISHTSANLDKATRPKELLKKLTFERIKTSFLALVNEVSEKIR